MVRNVDMFTYLPDCLLLLIISLLPFKEAVRTSILSSRWRNLFRATKNIELDESFFVKPHSSPVQDNIQRMNFLAFANQFIENYSQPEIEKFSLSFTFPETFSKDMKKFISFASERKVKSLYINFTGPEWSKIHEFYLFRSMFRLPVQAYQNLGLEILYLSSCRFRLPEFLKFISLKKLTLECLKLNTSSTFNKTIISNFRALEFLHLKKCWKIRILDISALELRNLVIEECSISKYIQIEAPKLRVLKYIGELKFMVFEGEHDALEVAELDYENEESCDGDKFVSMINELRSVRNLTICSYTLQVLPTRMEVTLTPPLEVRQLTLKSTMHEFEFLGISFVLMSCPFLEFLTINIGSRTIIDDYEPPEDFMPYNFWTRLDIKVADCIANTLKVVSVTNFKGTHNELQFLSYILRYGLVLEKMYVGVSQEEDSEGGCIEEYLRNVETLSKMASSNARDSLYYDSIHKVYSLVISFNV